MPSHQEDVRAVLEAAERRAAALAARDAEVLRSLHHPELRWTTHRGDVLGRDAYVRGNTEDELMWRRQTLEGADMTVERDTAILCAVVIDEVELGGERIENRLRLTQVWIRSPGGWVCLAGHAGPRLP